MAGPAAALTEAEVKRPTAPLLGSQRDGSRQRSARPTEPEQMHSARLEKPPPSLPHTPA